MKRIGLIGGMSWESTAEYYRIINEEVKNRLGGLHSAECIMYSVDFEEIECYQANGQWEQAGRRLAEVAQRVERAGADFIVICTNTMHKVFGQIEESVVIPVLHIADATAERIKNKNIRSVGLLGTKYTMEQDFYKARLEEKGIRVIVPNSMQREKINEIIYEELVLGKILSSSKTYYQDVMDYLIQAGAEGIILGCTEIGLLIKQKDCSVPVFDTTIIHAEKAVDTALSFENMPDEK